MKKIGMKASQLNKNGKNTGNTKPVVKSHGRAGSKRGIKRPGR